MRSSKSWPFFASSALLFFGVAATLAACRGEAPTEEGPAEKAGEAESACHGRRHAVPLSGVIVNIDDECLEAPPGELESGAPLFLSGCGTCSPSWTFSDSGEIFGPGGMCLDAAWGHTIDGTEVRMWECNGSDAQQWHLTHQGTIVGPGDKCLGSRSCGAPDETDLELQCCDGSPDQKWYFHPA